MTWEHRCKKPNPRRHLGSLLRFKAEGRSGPQSCLEHSTCNAGLNGSCYSRQIELKGFFFPYIVGVVCECNFFYVHCFMKLSIIMSIEKCATQDPASVAHWIYKCCICISGYADVSSRLSSIVGTHVQPIRLILASVRRPQKECTIFAGPLAWKKRLKSLLQLMQQLMQQKTRPMTKMLHLLPKNQALTRQMQVGQQPRYCVIAADPLGMQSAADFQF